MLLVLALALTSIVDLRQNPRNLHGLTRIRTSVLTQQGIREGIARLETSASGMTPAFTASIDAFAAQFKVFHLVHTEHSRHEDTVIFPVMNAWFPNRAGQQTIEHAEHHEVCISLVGTAVPRAMVRTCRRCCDASTLHCRLQQNNVSLCACKSCFACNETCMHGHITTPVRHSQMHHEIP